MRGLSPRHCTKIGRFGEPAGGLRQEYPE